MMDDVRFERFSTGDDLAERPLAEAAAAVFTAAVPVDQRDDRFEPGWDLRPGVVAVVARYGDQPIAFLGGLLDDDRLRLDALVAESTAAGSTLEPERLLTALIAEIRGPAAASGADLVEIWAKPERPWHRASIEAAGFSELRSLHQMRLVLPLDDQPVVPTRPFVPGKDEDALLRVNNRAFASHPDQGGMTRDDLASAAEQPWFDSDGIRLFDDPDGGPHLAGFCWTKVHPPLGPGQPPLGEIYAIGIDPDFHGRGLGRPMTAAGLEWLTSRGMDTGMLYVEADNHPAIKTYQRLGFTIHRTDRAWIREMGQWTP